MTVAVRMTGDERDLVRAQENIARGAKQITAEYKDLQRQSAQTQAYAKQALEETTKPLKEYQTRLNSLRTEYDAQKITLQEYRAGVDKLRGSYGQLGTSGIGALKGVGAELLAVGGSLLSISGTVQIISGAYRDWLETSRNLAEVQQANMKEMIAFQAMQEPGVGRERAKRVAQVAGGRATFAEAYDIAQAMQSSTGSFEKGVRLMDDILNAALLKVPARYGREIAIQALSQGEDARKWLRMTVIAGEISRRDAELLATGAPGLQPWQNKMFGFAAMGQLAGTFAQELPSYLRQAGYALSGVSPARKWFQRKGLGPEATEMQRLKALHEAGIDTIAELEGVGFKEIRQTAAVENLLKSYGTVMDYYKTLYKDTRDVRLLEKKRTGLEAEWPEQAVSRAIAEEEMAAQAAMTLGGDVGPLQRRYQERAFVTEMRKRGRRQAGWWTFGLNVFDEPTGELNPARAFLSRMLDPDVQGAWRAAQERTNETLDAIRKNTVQPPRRPRLPVPEQGQ